MNLLAGAIEGLSSILAVVCAAALTSSLISALILCSKRVVNRQNKNLDKNNFQIKYNRFALCLMAFLVCLLTAFAVYFIVYYFVDDDMPVGAVIGTTVGFGTGAIIALVFELLIYRWRICVQGNSIIYVPMVGKKSKYNLENVLRVEARQVEAKYSNPGAVRYLVYFNDSTKHAFAFNSLMVGANLLVQKLEDKVVFPLVPNIKI